MFIQTEETPNPASLKFIPDGIMVMENDTANFKSKEQAVKSPLAEELFKIDGVSSIFFGSDFITVTKSDEVEWKKIKTEILATIMDFFVAGKTVMRDASATTASTVDENDSEIVKQIKELIEIKVRPAVAMDGGDIIFRGFENGVVMLELKGSCSGCPSSTITLKNGIENMLKHYIPEVVSVEQISDYD
ncbi:MAG: NifU family protein [Rickettsiales bacterium]|nr:NifU family protein [Rickettsiales bacterium]